jgi:DNA-binding response OmpR family regulator
MNSHSKNKQIREALTALAAAHAHAVVDIERAIESLSYVLDAQEQSEEFAALSIGNDLLRPKIDRETLSIAWKHRICFLGNTLPFLFIERLARSPNRYVSYEDLLEEVWGGDRKESTIRGVVKRLRDRLEEAGMSQLAKAIDGSVMGHYGLILV